MNPHSDNFSKMFDRTSDVNNRDYEDEFNFDKFVYFIKLKSIITVEAFVLVNLEIDSDMKEPVLCRVIDIVDNVNLIPPRERRSITEQYTGPYLKLQIYLKIDAEVE